MWTGKPAQDVEGVVCAEAGILQARAVRRRADECRGETEMPQAGSGGGGKIGRCKNAMSKAEALFSLKARGGHRA